MAAATSGDWAGSLEEAEPEDQWVMLCFLAGRSVDIDPAEASAAVRRAELLLVTGGDPRRRLKLAGRAVTSMADDLDDPDARRRLAAGLAALESEALGSRAAEALRIVRADPDLAWRCFAATILGEALASAEDDA